MLCFDVRIVGRQLRVRIHRLEVVDDDERLGNESRLLGVTIDPFQGGYLTRCVSCQVPFGLFDEVDVDFLVPGCEMRREREGDPYGGLTGCSWRRGRALLAARTGRNACRRVEVDFLSTWDIRSLEGEDEGE